MVENSSNINKPEESLNSDGQQFPVKTFFWLFDIGGIVDHHY
jgi:hypothetical protein